jgi:restriction system protein
MVHCSSCGFPLPSTDAGPCPECGGVTKTVQLTARATAMGTARAILRVETPDLLLQTVILRGERTSEGTLIETVTLPWFEIIALLQKDPRVAYEITADKWEEIIAGAYKRAGFEEVTLTPRSGDYGRDVIATKKGICSVRVIDQVKAYKPPHLVTANDVRALMGVLQSDGASKGCLTTTADFAPRITTDPLIVPLIPSRLELVNGKTLFARLEELARQEKA